LQSAWKCTFELFRFNEWLLKQYEVFKKKLVFKVRLQLYLPLIVTVIVIIIVIIIIIIIFIIIINPILLPIHELERKLV